MCWGICLIEWQASEKTKPKHLVCFECGTNNKFIFLEGRCQENAITQSFSPYKDELERLIVTVKADWKESREDGILILYQNPCAYFLTKENA